MNNIRKGKIKKSLTLLIVVLLNSCSTPNDYSVCEAIRHEMIWGNGAYCSFTDIIRFDDIFYCCFREGVAHIFDSPDQYGKIRVIKSTDGINWEPFALISNSDYDLRDPKLIINQDNDLCLHFGLTVMNKGNVGNGYKIFSEDEINGITEIKNIFDFIRIGNNDEFSHFWLWRYKWVNNVAYGMCNSGNSSKLVLSTDGINFYPLADFEVCGPEADFVIERNGKMVMIMRAWNGNGYIGESYPPFTNWKWRESSKFIQSPKMLEVDGHILVAGRSSNGTAIWEYSEGDLKLLSNIVGKLDYGYPGLIISDDELVMSYYDDREGHPSIFFINYKLESIFRNN